jgi:hypothetical protein
VYGYFATDAIKVSKLLFFLNVVTSISHEGVYFPREGTKITKQFSSARSMALREIFSV